MHLPFLAPKEGTSWKGHEMALAGIWTRRAGRRGFCALKDVRCVALSQSQQCRFACRPKHVRTAVFASQPLVLNASDPELKHLFDEGPIEAAYANTFLANLNGHEQGLLQNWAKQTLQDIYPRYNFSDPKPGTCWNGWKRGSDKAAYDFLMDGRKVEIKSSRMSHDARHKRWRVYISIILSSQ